MAATSGASKTGSKIDRQRRKLLKLIAAGGAGLITSPWTFQSSRAAPKTIKIGMITPETGPIAAFGEPSKWVAEEVSKFLGDGIVVAGEKHTVEILNRDSQSNPNRASEVAAQLINNDKSRHHDRLVDRRHDQSGGRSVRARRRALHHLGRSVAGVVLRPQGRPEEGLRVDLPLLLGLRHGRQHVRRDVADAADQQDRRHHADQRSRRHRRQRPGAWLAGHHQKPRLRRALPRPLSAAVRRLHGADRATEEHELPISAAAFSTRRNSRFSGRNARSRATSPRS